MDDKQELEIKKIRAEYEDHEITKTDELKALNKKVHLPTQIFGYVFGSLFTLVFGAGMCMTMKVILADTSYGFVLGIILGVIGIIAVTLNPIICKKMLAHSRKKHQAEILKLSDEILAEKGN